MKNKWILIQVVNYKGELIPLWDKRITWEEDDFYGDSLILKYTRVVPIKALLNIVTKEISLGEIIEIKGTKSVKYKINEDVYIEVDYSVNKVHSQLKKGKIKDILWKEVEHTVHKLGKDLDDYYKDSIKNFDRNKLYAIKIYKPSYLMYSGEIINWEYKLYKKA